LNLEACLTDLTNLCNNISKQLNISNPEIVFRISTIHKMVNKSPATKEDFLKLEGVTEHQWTKFQGEQFLNIIKQYNKAKTTSTSKQGKNTKLPYWNKRVSTKKRS